MRLISSVLTEESKMKVESAASFIVRPGTSTSFELDTCGVAFETFDLDDALENCFSTLVRDMHCVFHVAPIQLCSRRRSLLRYPSLASKLPTIAVQGWCFPPREMRLGPSSTCSNSASVVAANRSLPVPLWHSEGSVVVK